MLLDELELREKKERLSMEGSKIKETPIELDIEDLKEALYTVED